jgi:hypothetical protein
MSMLITERAVITPHKTARVRPVVAPAPVVSAAPEAIAPVVYNPQPMVAVEPKTQINPIKRQNLLLLVLVLVPLIGAVSNLLTYGVLR